MCGERQRGALLDRYPLDTPRVTTDDAAPRLDAGFIASLADARSLALSECAMPVPLPDLCSSYGGEGHERDYERVYDTPAGPRSGASRTSDDACLIPRPHTNGACTTRVSPRPPCFSTARRAHNESVGARKHGLARTHRQLYQARARRLARRCSRSSCSLSRPTHPRGYTDGAADRELSRRRPRRARARAMGTQHVQPAARVRANPPLPEAAATANPSDQLVQNVCGSSSSMCS
jgi:hypothetical protein